jgi:putative endonuclease
MPYVYILRCSDGSYYVGSTFNLERRLWQHNKSDKEGAAYTRRRRPVELVWSGWYDSVRDAYMMEKQIQGWRRDKREALIHGRYDLLPELAASPDPPPATR